MLNIYFFSKIFEENYILSLFQSMYQFCSYIL